MIALLKAEDGQAQAHVRPFAPRQPVTHPTMAETAIAAQPRERDAVLSHAAASPDPRIAQLERQADDLAAQLHSATLAAETREAEAFARGERAGAEQAGTRERDRLSLLAAALETTGHAYAERFRHLEALSLEIAQTALARLFGDRSRYADMIAESVRHQLDQLDRTLVTAIRVSPEDFTDAEAIAQLAAQAPEIALHTDPTLGEGECAIDLQLGQIDAGVSGQWARLSRLLDSMAGPGEAA